MVCIWSSLSLPAVYNSLLKNKKVVEGEEEAALSLTVHAQQPRMILDNTTHVKIRVPHNKCTALSVLTEVCDIGQS